MKGTQNVCDLSFIWKHVGIDRKRLMSLSHGAYCCVKSSTNKIIFGAGVKLSIDSSKSHFAFLKYDFTIELPQFSYRKCMSVLTLFFGKSEGGSEKLIIWSQSHGCQK